MKTVEIFHPTKKFNLTLPDLPRQLNLLSGFWSDKKLSFCGKKLEHPQHLTCYELISNSNGVYEWQGNGHPRIYLKTTSVSLIHPSQSWKLFAIGGNDDYSSSVRIYNLQSQQVQENSEAFPKEDMYNFPCTFNLENQILHVIGKLNIISKFSQVNH